MFFALELDQFNISNVLTSDKTKNNIMNNSDFYRLYFSNENISINGIFLKFDLENIKIEQYFNKIKCCFEETNNNLNTIKTIINIEKNILGICNDINVKPSYRIEEQMSNKYIKIFDQKKVKLGNYKKLSILLKISGIWSSNQQKEYGLTFRFFIND
tara:strand:- start:45 stop:515 length:471 start_codon:yes stop_codon:yes gene_type:complete